MKNEKSVFKDNRGATAIEYGLMIGLIAIAVITTLGEIGTGINDNLTTAGDAMDNN